MLPFAFLLLDQLLEGCIAHKAGEVVIKNRWAFQQNGEPGCI